jgi:hypothetical protein
MAVDSRAPVTIAGDVIVQHMAPKIWIPSSVTASNDLIGSPTRTITTRLEAIAAARELLRPGRRLYIHHHDDANWEAVE